MDSCEIATVALGASDDRIRASMALLSMEERHRAARFVFERDRNRFIMARAHLRQLLAARLGMRPASIKLACGVHGKPSLALNNNDLDLRFSVSHSKDIAVYAFALGREVGVDIEAICAIRDADDIAACFFSQREYEEYCALDDHDKPLGFFNCWTRKEAFVKSLGDGLRYPLDNFDVSLTPGKPTKIFRVEDRFGEDCGWTVHSFVPSPGFIGALVVQRLADERCSSMVRHCT